MASEVVQFRSDPDGLAFLREQGLNPNQVARDAFQKELRRLRAEGQMRRLRKLIGDGIPWGQPPEDMVRQMRDERSAEMARRLG